MVTYGRDAMIEEVWKIVLDDIVYIPLHHQERLGDARQLEIPVYPWVPTPRGAVKRPDELVDDASGGIARLPSAR